MQLSALVLASLLPAFGLALPAGGNPGANAGAKSVGAKAAAGTGKATAKAPATAAASGNAAGNATAQAATNGTVSDKAAGGATGDAAQGVSDTQVGNAVTSWMADTGKVTNFLNTATSFSGDEFTKQATIALNAEKDELNHKAVLDEALGQNSMVQAANEVLANQGSFQAVVDALQKMVNEGPDAAQATVNEINTNRCVNVLPNIDMYFAAAGSSTVTAVRPTGCLEVDGANVLPTGGASGAPAAAPAGGAANNNQTQASTTAAAGGAQATGAAKGAAKGAASSTAGANAGNAKATGAAAAGADNAAGSATKATGGAAAAATGKASANTAGTAKKAASNAGANQAASANAKGNAN